MTLREFYAVHGRQGLEKLAERSGSTVGSITQIFQGNGALSARRAEKLAKASMGLISELELLYPERYRPELKKLKTNQEGDVCTKTVGTHES